jgi:hypothetical protein
MQAQAQAHAQAHVRNQCAEAPIARPQSCQEYLSLSDLAPAPAPTPAAFAGVVRPVAWSPPRGLPFVSDDPAGRMEAAEKAVSDLMDEDDELLAICGQLTQDPCPTFTAKPTSAFRQVAVTPLAQPKEFPDMGSISSPTTVADAFRDSPCMAVGKGFRFEGFEDASELDQRLKGIEPFAAYEQTLRGLQSAASITPVRLFSDADDAPGLCLPEAGERAWTQTSAWTPVPALGAGDWTASR